MKLKGVLFTFETIEQMRQLPGTWSTSDFRSLLSAIEVDDASEYADNELVDVAVMALQDLSEREALEAILETLFPGQFTAGQTQNLTEELKEESPWDDYPDIADHRALYIALDLMSSVFPSHYPEPSHSQVTVAVEHPELDKALAHHRLDEAMLLRAVARSEDDHCRLNRLFPDQIKGAKFPEAPQLVWHMEISGSASNQRRLKVHGSSYWFNGLEEGSQSEEDLTWA